MKQIKDKKLKNYKFIDLFCGIGGFNLALSSFGAKCVFASDIDPAAVKTYENNFNIKVSGDITKIEPKDIPSHDIICAGFPCQSFSISGKKKGLDDPRGRLYKNVVNIAKYHKPKLIILENVKNLETHNNGETLRQIKNDFRNIGYQIFSQVLNASDFGVPQARKRIYFVAFRDDLKINDFKFPEKLNIKTELNFILEDCYSDNVVVNRKDVNLYENKVKIKNNSLNRIGEIGKGRQGERIYSPKGHSITLSSQGGGVGGKTGMYLINNVIRKLTPRECARLMGFPDTFIMSEGINTSYCQFGNSVVIDVLQYIVEQIINYMEFYNE